MTFHRRDTSRTVKDQQQASGERADEPGGGGVREIQSKSRLEQRATPLKCAPEDPRDPSREISGDEWIGVTNTRTLSTADVVEVNRIRAENSPRARD